MPGELGKRVTNEVIVAKFNQTSTSLSGTAEGLRISLKELEAGEGEPLVLVQSAQSTSYNCDSAGAYSCLLMDHICDFVYRHVPVSLNFSLDLRGVHSTVRADLKKDKEGLKEYEDFLTTIGKRKAELQARIKANKAWVVSVLLL